MLAEDVKIDFSGFEPSHDVRSALYFILNKLHLKSPSQSFFSVTFTLTHGIYEGVIKVTSSAENFVAKATDVHITELGAKLSEKLLGKMDQWKSSRFDK
jgi:hypothetical protein